MKSSTFNEFQSSKLKGNPEILNIVEKYKIASLISRMKNIKDSNKALMCAKKIINKKQK